MASYDPTKKVDRRKGKSQGPACAKQLDRPSSSFLWVNDQNGQELDSLSAGSKLSFVRSRNNRLGREARLNNLKTSVKPFPGRQPPVAQELPKSSQRCQIWHCTDPQHQHGSPIKTNPQTGFIEAFPFLSPNANQSINFYYHYYRVYASTGSFPLSSEVMTVYFFQEAMKQPALIDAILFMSAASRTSSLKFEDASPLLLQRTVQDSIQLRSRAVRSLQNFLMSSSKVFSERTILVVAHLLGVECAEAHTEAVNAHINGLQNLVKGLGGLDNMSIRTLSTLYTCDVMKGMVQDSPPMFEISRKWENWIRENSWCIGVKAQYARIPSLGEGFFNSPWSQELPKELQTILKIFQTLIPCHERMVQTDSRQMPVENDCLLFAVHRLYSLRYKVQLPFFQDTICVSVLIYCIVRIWGFHGKPCLEFISQNLRLLLEVCYQDMEQSTPDLLFWSLFLGGLVSRGHKVRDWFLGCLKACAEKASIVDFDGASSVLKGFFFVPRSTNEPARELWAAIIAF